MSRPRIVIVGAGFAGYRAARTLSRLARNKADITLLNPTDYFLYLPLLPQVAAGILEPRRVTVSLSGTLPHVRLVLGEADAIDLDGRTVHYTGPEGDGGTLTFDRLILAAGSVNKLLPIPGVAEHAHGFRGLPEALYLRDHVTRQVELAAAADDPESCSARCTFVVVGAGYTGTEVAAQGKLFTDSQVRKHPLRAGIRPRWMLLDIAERVLPELDERLSRTADRVLRQRGVEVRMGTSVKEATHSGVLLTDGEFVDTRTLVWCVGVRPDPLAESLGLPLERGRLLVDPLLQVPGRPEVFAAGDGAAVPDLEKPGAYTPMTAQHAWRQGKAVAHNVAASLGIGERRAYRHRDMGFVVDLGGVKAAANPLGVHLSGVAAGAVARGYHLAAMPGNRVRVAADWLLDAVLPRQAVQLGLVRAWSVPLDTASPEVPRVPGRGETEGEGGVGSRSGAGPAKGSGAGPATAAGAVEHAGAGRDPGSSGAGSDPAAPAKGFESPSSADHPDAIEAQDSKRFGAPLSVRRPDAVKGGGASGRGRAGTPEKSGPPDPVQDPDAAKHDEPPGPVKRPDPRPHGKPRPGTPAGGAPSTAAPGNGEPSSGAPAGGDPVTAAPGNGEPSSGAPAGSAPSTVTPETGEPLPGTPSIHKPHPDAPTAPEPPEHRFHNPSEGAS
ncbi:FAD-dependent oxidoreductase [Streptomyces sp. T12]|uniref:FAD-dependent oxidoreductase n=2 Tax=unclassified Streptomyces TaxID=2593676 RepID=UPI0023658B55|nr:FAD-dependent oxidoreductase [Streptomyces sp. T12]WDF42618.1 FAD-dependent oxidoreductase [Streptomyces sp. T12]